VLDIRQRLERDASKFVGTDGGAPARRVQALNWSLAESRPKNENIHRIIWEHPI